LVLDDTFEGIPYRQETDSFGSEGAGDGSHEIDLGLQAASGEDGDFGRVGAQRRRQSMFRSVQGVLLGGKITAERSDENRQGKETADQNEKNWDEFEHTNATQLHLFFGLLLIKFFFIYLWPTRSLKNKSRCKKFFFLSYFACKNKFQFFFFF
jgi:hypothetical protein